MILEQKRWMCYSYFNRIPAFAFTTTHLFSPVKKVIKGMVRVPHPTMIAEIKDENFVESWSQTTRSKIRKAEAENFELKRGGDLLPGILKLFEETARAKNLRGHYEKDFESRP